MAPKIEPVVNATTKSPSSNNSNNNNINDADVNNVVTSTKHDRLVHTLPILVTLDMFAVALVVPLLHTYYKLAGVSSSTQRELLSSLFSASQILGGLLLGAAGDSGLMSRKSILLLSFMGSALAYGLIGFFGRSLYGLVFSRVIVGLVKQTMTISTALLTEYTSKEERATHMGRMTAGTTIAWIVGPSAGGYMYKTFGAPAPALLACALFLIISALGFILLPGSSTRSQVKVEGVHKTNQKEGTLIENLRSCLQSKTVTSALVSLLLFSWFTRATSYASMGSFYEDMWGFEAHQRGYLQSYKSVLSFIIQGTLVRPLLSIAGGERRATVFASTLLAIATSIESMSSLSVFLFVVSPVVAASVAVLSLSLRSLLTQVCPKKSIGSVLASLDVLQNVAAVTVPFYRTLLFSLLHYLTICAKGSAEECSLMTGDPEPRVWLYSSAFHWIIFAVVTSILMRFASKEYIVDNENITKEDKEGGKIKES